MTLSGSGSTSKEGENLISTFCPTTTACTLSSYDREPTIVTAACNALGIPAAPLTNNAQGDSLPPVLGAALYIHAWYFRSDTHIF